MNRPSLPLRSIGNSRGFTLLEIAIVVTMIGIMSAVFIPRIYTQTRTYEVAESARRIHTEISKLRSLAVAEQREYELALSDNTIQIKRKGAGDAVTLTERLPSGAIAALNGEDEGSITFYPTGRVDIAGSLVIDDTVRRHTIRILASGLTRWEPE